MKLKLALFVIGTALIACVSTWDQLSGDGADAAAQWADTYAAAMQAKVAESPELATLNEIERVAAQIEQQVLAPWSAGWAAGSDATLKTLGVAETVWLSWTQPQTVSHHTVDGIEESKQRIVPGDDDSGDYLDGFARLDSVVLELAEIQPEKARVSATVRLDLRGVQRDGSRRNDRGLVDMHLIQRSGQWHISRLVQASLESVVGRRPPAFEDATVALGMNSLPVTDRQEAIRRGGYALVVADYDGDSRPDLLVGNYGPTMLLRNTGSGFEDVTAQAGLDELDGVVKSAAFVDLDQDGDRDLALLRFVVGSSDDRGDFVAYENRGDGTFVRRGDVLPKRRSYDRAMPLAMGDFDGDGRVDIYVGFPGIRDFTSGISTRERPQWLASQGIWLNRGGWRFDEAPEGETIVASNSVYAHASVASDFDGDGHLDVLVVDDSGRVNPVYRNRGDGRFEEVSQEVGLNTGGWSMGLTTGDYDGDGDLDVMSTNIALNAGQRMAAATLGHLMPESDIDRVMDRIRGNYRGLVLFENQGDGTFVEVTQEAGLSWEGEAVAAGEWIDYNHDGHLDYYLPNGLWTGGPKDLDSLFVRAEIAGHWDPALGGTPADPTAKEPMANDIHATSAFSHQAGPNPLLTLLRSHRSGPDAALTYSIAGAQRNRLYRNNGDGTFTEVGYLENADRIEDGYIVAPVDIDQDGRQDLILRNTDPALGHHYAPVVALRNVHPANKTVALSFQTAAGDKDAIGLLAAAEVGGRTLTREVRAVNGAVQGESGLFFGLGTSDQIDRLTLHWPGADGGVQVVENLPAGRHLITQK